jgi:hypothetical protein
VSVRAPACTPMPPSHHRCTSHPRSLVSDSIAEASTESACLTGFKAFLDATKAAYSAIDIRGICMYPARALSYSNCSTKAALRADSISPAGMMSLLNMLVERSTQPDALLPLRVLHTSNALSPTHQAFAHDDITPECIAAGFGQCYYLLLKVCSSAIASHSCSP